MIQPQTWVSIMICVFCATSSIWLFAQGYINLKSGKITKFGLDAFWYFIDVQVRKFIKLRYPSRQNDSKIFRKTGIMTMLLAFILAKTAIDIFINNILLHIK